MRLKIGYKARQNEKEMIAGPRARVKLRTG